MVHLGDNLEDYWAYQLLDEIIRQLKEGNAGDIDELKERMVEFNMLVKYEKKKHDDLDWFDKYLLEVASFDRVGIRRKMVAVKQMIDKFGEKHEEI